ncbi:MAG: cell wall hydrolase [Lentilitoribacter sp.]
MFTPTIVAHSDTAALLSSLGNQDDRWRMHITTAPAGSIEKAQMAFADPILTGSVAASAGLDLGNGETIAFDAKIGGKELTPDEDRITRHLKKGRVIAVAPSQPPKNFSAGSITGKQSALEIPKSSNDVAMVFKKQDIEGKELQVASVFYKKQNKPQISAQVPTMLASLITNDNPDILATAYAPPQKDYAKQSPFASILNDGPKRGRFIPPIEKGDHAWADDPLPPAAFSAEQQRCLAVGIYFEARGEKLSGQAAVAQVILNRVRNPTYPNTICGVVYQNKTWRNRCQFSFACDGIRDRVRSPKAWNIAEEIALATTAGKIWFKQVGSSTHYHATYVRPRWAKKMRRVGRIGLHIFYVTHNGGWS